MPLLASEPATAARMALPLPPDLRVSASALVPASAAASAAPAARRRSSKAREPSTARPLRATRTTSARATTISDWPSARERSSLPILSPFLTSLAAAELRHGGLAVQVQQLADPGVAEERAVLVGHAHGGLRRGAAAAAAGDRDVGAADRGAEPAQ